MDVNNQQLSKLLDKTDVAFKQLMQNPGSAEFNDAYEHAKQDLDVYLSELREQLKQRYKQF
ncbi:hypothetical protein [Aliiglaciecola sp. M165]|uniref:hypothetical protein n=1 Tax=Aliiglaciecola sp. M165 TaxID=2593649 RepID=UPI0011804622|nr:hypothetical protein [Aliiglaciecola sp. M165]TRY32142.1 hypothetical protein FM019_10030 [Aliiglaciecola sp. M165]